MDGTKKDGVKGSDAGTSNSGIWWITRRESTWTKRGGENKDFYVDRSC